MFKSRLAFVVIMLASLGDGTAFTQEHRGTPKQSGRVGDRSSDQAKARFVLTGHQERMIA